MKQESTLKYTLRLAVTLLLITSVVAAVLAGFIFFCAAIIVHLNAEKLQY